MAAVPVETRRAPRLPARCPVEVAFGAGRWTGFTEDLGTGGCRIVARMALRPGEPLSLRLRYASVDFALDVVGTVAWTARRPPWRAGVAFARGQEAKARRFVRALLARSPELADAPEGGPRSAPPPGSRNRAQPRSQAPAQLAPRAARLRALILAARSHAASGNVEEARRNLLSALELAPGDPEAQAGLQALGPAFGS
jgi:plasmid stabilization system protein ParE